MRPVLSGLIQLNRVNVIHKDIKPKNLIWKYKEIEWRKNELVVIDYGLSEILLNENVLKSNGGTIGFMAPEIFARKKSKVQSSIQ